MSHYSRFIELAEQSWENFKAEGHLMFRDKDAYHKHGTDYLLFNSTAQLMRRATIIRLRGDQSAIFMDTPVDPQQDFKTWLRLPFQHVYIQLEQPVTFFDYAPRTPEQLVEWQRDYDSAPSDEERERLRFLRESPNPLIRGVLISQTDDPKSLKATNLEHEPNVLDFPLSQAVRVIHAVFLIPLAAFEMNIHSFTMCITEDNRLATAKRFSSAATLTRATQWLVGIINFLSSPSVKLVPNTPSRELQRARAKRGKPPLEDWYEITFRKHIREYSHNKKSEKKWEHSYRYDVRGHFKTFTKGPMVGRRIWCPAHHRGVKHKLYRPKGYRSEE